MGYAARRSDAARIMGGQVVAGLLRAAESSIGLSELSAELAEQCLQAVAGEINLSPQEQLDYRRNVIEIRASITTVRGDLARMREHLTQGET